MTTRKSKLTQLLCIGSLLFILGCKVNYSFTGASVSPDIHTISIAVFPSYAALAPPNLSQTFTESLKDIFLRQTNLTLVRANGDIQIEGEITGYDERPEAVSGSETATLTRLTITVKVRYTDTKDETKSYEQSFSNFAQFDGGTNLSTVEQTLITEINEKLTQDIFNKSLGNW
ncbi:MAG: LptE family protein [Flavobacteriales bacterium]